jgi:hypothetical protein
MPPTQHPDWVVLDEDTPEPSRPKISVSTPYSWEREKPIQLRGLRAGQRTQLGAGRGPIKQIQKSGHPLNWPLVALALTLGLCIASTAIHHRTRKAGLEANEDSSLVQVAPEDAGVIPRFGHFRLAGPADFDPDAVAWLRNSGQSASGKLPGFYSGSRKSNAYVLIGEGTERRIVILADGGVRYNAEYPVVAVAARVPKEFIQKINWADPSPPEFQGDGLLIVRAADDPASGVILFLQGDVNPLQRESIVLRGHPVDYREVPLGRVP